MPPHSAAQSSPMIGTGISRWHERSLSHTASVRVERRSLEWARQQTAAPKSQQKSGQSHVSQPASSVVQLRVFLGVLGIAEASAMQERRPWMLEGEPEPWHTSHH